ncbi:MAG TPA: methylated-DNA--[protein]-cysteine S-methyltransferase [Solirubrobacteraceae bacterium]
MNLLYTTHPSPIGELLLVGDGRALHALHMLAGRRPPPIDARWRRAPEAFTDVTTQLEEYFQGRRTSFTVPLALAGTPFQLRVWSALQEIRYGQTTSYGELAAHIGQPTASRAVGLANGRNPVAVIVPCHRVVGADGTLTGYGGGLERKRLLLDLESGVVPLGQLEATAVAAPQLEAAAVSLPARATLG